MIKKVLSFNDVLITPAFSIVRSRRDVDTTVDFLGSYRLPVISSNMDSVTESGTANAMRECHALGALHRFMSIEKNINQYKLSPSDTIISVGIGDIEKERVEALVAAGSHNILLDVAHGASSSVVDMVRFIYSINSDLKIIVGNFATARQILDFKYHLGNSYVTSWKLGIGSGSGCSTRIVTGCGWPTLASLLDCKGKITEPLIADGGITGSGDLAKSIAAGATVVMAGRLFAGTDESPGDILRPTQYENKYKRYRGSASAESYEVQGKTSEWRVPEGESMLVPYVGSIKTVLQQLDAGLRSSMSYVGAHTIQEFKENAELVEITSSGHIESTPHGLNKC